MSNKPAPKLEDKLCGMLRPAAGGEDGGVEDGGVEVVVPLFEPGNEALVVDEAFFLSEGGA